MLEYSCNVENQFTECPSEASDPFELLNARKAKAAGEQKIRKKQAAENKALSKPSVQEPIQPQEAVPQKVVSPQQKEQPRDEIQERSQRGRGRGRGTFSQRGGDFQRKEDRRQYQAQRRFEDRPPRQQFDQQRRFEDRPQRQSDDRRRYDDNKAQVQFSQDEPPKEQQENKSDELSEVKQERSNQPKRGFETITFRRGGRGGRYEGDRGRPLQNFSSWSDQFTVHGVEDIVESQQRQFRPPFRARDRHNAHFEQSGKRQFERHSGNYKTTVRGVEKRQGSGAYNWGNPTHIVDLDMTGFTEETPSQDVTVEESEQPKDVVEVEEREGQVERSPSPVQMTLDQYKEQQRKLKVESKSEAVRQAGEGEDLSKWKVHNQAYHKKDFGLTKYTIAKDIPENRDETKDENFVEEGDDDLSQNLKRNLFIGPRQTNSYRGSRNTRGRDMRDRSDRGRSDFNSRGGRGSDTVFYGNRGRGSNRGSEPRERGRVPRNIERPPDPSDFPELC